LRSEKDHPPILSEQFFHLLFFLLLFIRLLLELNNLIYLSVLALVMINGARIWCRLSLRKVSARMELDRSKVFPGESITMYGEVSGSGLLPAWLQLDVPLPEGILPAEGDVLYTQNGLLWREKLTWSWHLSARKRGCYNVGPLNLCGSDLLGFFQQNKEIEFSSHITVFPRIISLNPLPAPLEEFFGKHGANIPVVDTVYPIATRDYQPGRPARHIHWKASLRHNKLQERVFEPTSHRNILLAIDVEGFRESGDEKSFEDLLEVAATLAHQLYLGGNSFGLLSNGETLHRKSAVLPLLRGEAHLQTLLEGLAALQMDMSQSFASLLKQSHELFQGSSCFYLARGGKTGEISRILSLYRFTTIFILHEYGADTPEWIGKRVFKLDDIHGRSEAVV